MKSWLSLLVCAVLASPAYADYGDQTVTADIVMGLGMIVPSSGGPNASALVGWNALPPAIHLAHQRPKEAAIDLGMRALATGAVYACVTHHFDGHLALAVLLAPASYAAIMIVDGAVLADEDDHPKTQAHIAPLVSLRF